MSGPVSQAARDAAAEWMEHFRPAGWQNAVANIPIGAADLSWSVQAFQRVIDQTRAEAEAAMRMEVERLRGMLEHYADTYCEGVGECVGDFCGKLPEETCGGCPARAALGEQP